MSYAQIANVFQYLHRELPASANNKGVWEQGILTNANYLHRDLLTSANNKEVWEQNDGRYWNKIPFDIPYAHIANGFQYLHRDLLTSANNKGGKEQYLLTNANNKGVWIQFDGRYRNKLSDFGRRCTLGVGFQKCVTMVPKKINKGGYP